MNGCETRARSFINKAETWFFGYMDILSLKQTVLGSFTLQLDSFISLGTITNLSYVKAAITEYTFSFYNCKSCEL
jgi:hypothetical protein